MEKQESGYSQWSRHDVGSSHLYLSGKLHSKSCAQHHYGQLFRIYDIPYGYQIHRIAIGGMPDLWCLFFCVLFTLTVLGAAIITINYLF